MGCLTSKSAEASGNPASSVSPKELDADDLDVIFVDCDDTIYFNNWATAARLKNKISHFTSRKLGLEESYAWRLYQQYGTALRGLLSENLIPPERVEEYL